MEEIIKALIQIDKDAVQKEGDLKKKLMDMDDEKRRGIRDIRGNLERRMNEDIEAYRKEIDSQYAKEEKEILQDSQERLLKLEKKSSAFTTDAARDAFQIILQKLEE